MDSDSKETVGFSEHLSLTYALSRLISWPKEIGRNAEKGHQKTTAGCCQQYLSHLSKGKYL